MRRTAIAALAPIALVAVLACASPALAEQWKWYAVSGGAIAYDQQSLKVDVKAGTASANTLIYFQKARESVAGDYLFQAERLEFECRVGRHRWSQSAVLDQKGGIVVSR